MPDSTTATISSSTLTGTPSCASAVTANTATTPTSASRPKEPGRSICSAIRSTSRRASPPSTKPASISPIATSTRGRYRMPAFSESERNSRPSSESAAKITTTSRPMRIAPAIYPRQRVCDPEPLEHRVGADPLAEGVHARRLEHADERPPDQRDDDPADDEQDQRTGQSGRNPPSPSPARSRMVAKVIGAGMPGTTLPHPWRPRTRPCRRRTAHGRPPCRAGGPHHGSGGYLATAGPCPRPAPTAGCARAARPG